METAHYTLSPELMKAATREYFLKTRGLFYVIIFLFHVFVFTIGGIRRYCLLCRSSCDVRHF